MAAALDATADAPAPAPAQTSLMRRFLLTFVPLAVVLYGVLPFVFGGQAYWLNVLTNSSLLAFASLGVWLTFSIGRVNIAQGAFAMIGGYTTGLLSTNLGVSFWICLPLSGLIAAAVGVVIGWPLLRLRGIYFAMVTLSLTEAVRLAFLNVAGSGGVTNIPNPPGIDTPLAFYFFGATMLIVGYAVVWRLGNSRLGWVFRSMRQNEELASSIGINIARYRVLAFAVCCGMGGMAGSAFASLQQNIYPQSYTVSDSINFMLYCFLGGLEFVLGPIVGTFGLVLAFELLREIQEYQALLYGVLMIIVMLFLPNGILSLGTIFVRRAGGKS
ncbi:branched-chain amino acid ABC transporter permease [Acuticoccus kandeliae]|uniref:branched-chain amino acid ABC transporter permease n=1 Tax=Acuticoccus kandeliae TaxID=2073160 RepID=UPI00196B1B3C|nr:branched-chain amino acid ABC transporter permease [Acuticoccus kandeliae]